MTEQPGVRDEEVREREERIELVKFHRAHVIEIIYFSVIGAAALIAISFFVDPQWAWFLRGGILGLSLTFIYILGRVLQQSTR
jgi:hypothetical protein